MQSTRGTALGFALALVACGGQVGPRDGGSPADGASEDGTTPACPATQPPTASACAKNGQMCNYSTRCVGSGPFAVPCTCMNGEWSCLIPRCDADAGVTETCPTSAPDGGELCAATGLACDYGSGCSLEECTCLAPVPGAPNPSQWSCTYSPCVDAGPIDASSD